MIVKDVTYLGVIDGLARELQDVLTAYNNRANGLTEKAPLLALRLEQNEVLTETLRRQRRHLRFMNGEKIEPETHSVEAVLTAFGGVVF